MTEAGRLLLNVLRLADEGPLADTVSADWLAGITLIEAEAAALERERLRQAIDDNPGIYVTDVDDWCVPRTSLDRILDEPTP